MEEERPMWLGLLDSVRAVTGGGQGLNNSKKPF